MQRDLRDLARPSPDEPERPPVDMRKIYIRVGGVLAVVWIVALIVTRWTIIPMFVAGALTLAAIAAAIWLVRYVNKSRDMAAILRAGSQTEEGRQEALKKLETGGKKGDRPAAIARAQ